MRPKPNLIGGFIWDMIDQGIEKKTDDGRSFYAYGGDYGDVPNSSNFCFNGVFASDRTPNPHAWECRYVFQPVAFSNKGLEGGQVKVTNRFDFQNLNQYQIKWSVFENGSEIKLGTLDPQDIEAATDAVVKIPLDEISFDGKSEYWLRLSVHESSKQLWCEEDFEIASDKLFLDPGKPKTSYASQAAKPEVNQSEDGFVIKGESFTAQISKRTGQLTSWVIDGDEQIQQPMRPSFWRPMTDNDQRFLGFGGKKKIWSKVNDGLKTKKVTVQPSSNDSLNVVVQQYFKDQVDLQTTYGFHGDGSIAVHLKLESDPKLPDMPKFGMTMGVTKKYDQTEYYGRGPWENYSDRKRGAEVGLYSAQTDDMFNSYAQPQENGNHTDTRWAKLQTVDASSGIVIEGLPLVNFSVWPYSSQSIEAAKHPTELGDQEFYTLNIDLAQSGVGGMKAKPMDHQKVLSGSLDFKFVLRPLRHRSD